MNISRIGLDLAKLVFQVHAVDRFEKVVLRKQLPRSKVLGFFKELAPCLVGMEACGGAHYWARELTKMGHTVKLIAPQFVKPYVKSNKNDRNDAEAICEAVSRPHMRFVAIKTTAQQDMQTLHRVRSELIKQRTATTNQSRGFLAENGIVLSRQVQVLRRALPDILEDAENGLSEAMRSILQGQYDELLHVDKRIALVEEKIDELARKDIRVQRLMAIPGVGVLSATALVAAVGDARQFKRSRDMAAWLGLVPRQHSSGGKDRLLGISKRGDSYIRTLFIHGARNVVRWAPGKEDPRSQWVSRLAERRPSNVVSVAVANKNARIAWAILTREERYHHVKTAA